MVSIRGNLVGLVPLAAVLDVHGAAGHGAADAQEDRDWQVVVMDADGEWVGLVDRRARSASGDHGQARRPLPHGGGAIAGATVLGDGRVALVLEPAAIAAAALAYARRQDPGIRGKSRW